jgi:hypothetical protein
MRTSAAYLSSGLAFSLPLSSTFSYFIRGDRDLHYSLEECLRLTEKQIVRYK